MRSRGRSPRGPRSAPAPPPTVPRRGPWSGIRRRTEDARTGSATLTARHGAPPARARRELLAAAAGRTLRTPAPARTHEVRCGDVSG
ncbi:hypothetical protein SSCG_01993 [Streptomyces clavuligerus]|nr:hypothetical protein SSCG_01993 [Streptomyces clavuligerus]